MHISSHGRPTSRPLTLSASPDYLTAKVSEPDSILPVLKFDCHSCHHGNQILIVCREILESLAIHMASTVNSGADEEIHRLRDDNEQLRDDLLTLLHPPQDQATDGSIREDFGNLCQSVDFWVDNIIENSSLEKHGVQLGRREQDLLKEVGIDRLSPKDDNAIASLILSVAVQRELQRRIFDRLCPVGITKQQETVIEQVLQGMQSLESGKGKQVK